MFADRARIIIRSGKGGDGHVSFRRELFVPDGGPDGGDGGKGGDVIFEVDKGLNTLIEYRHRRKFSAQDGEPGGKRRCHGANGEDIVLRVPEGTVIKEAESGQVIADMSGENSRQVILRGGRGGNGIAVAVNAYQATVCAQALKYFRRMSAAAQRAVDVCSARAYGKSLHTLLEQYRFVGEFQIHIPPYQHSAPPSPTASISRISPTR